MQVTELFTSELEKELIRNPHGNLDDFLPEPHSSLPQIQENLLYICASGRRILKLMEQYAFSNLDGYMLLRTREGSGIIEVTGDSCTLKKDDFLFWDCEDFIQMKSLTPEWHIDIMFFNGASVTTYYEEICKMSFPVFHIPQETFTECHFSEAMAMGSVITVHHAFMEHRLLTNLLTDLIADICMTHDTQKGKAVPAYIDELRRLFTNNCEVDYSMDELAARFHVNRYRMTREFSRFVGMTPLKYLNNIRIEQARALLESTNLAIGAVGAAVGIPNSTHFINQFKTKLGVTPQAYRDGYRAFREVR